jgi:hypothetical protein
MPSKYSLLDTYMSHCDYRKQLWNEINAVRIRIANREDELKRITQLKLKDEEQLRMADAHFTRISKEIKELQDKLCKENDE